MPIDIVLPRLNSYNFFIKNQSNNKRLIVCFNEIKRFSNSEITNETFLEKLKEIVPINNIILSASEFYRLFDEKFPEVASTNHGINISRTYALEMPKK